MLSPGMSRRSIQNLTVSLPSGSSLTDSNMAEMSSPSKTWRTLNPLSILMCCPSRGCFLRRSRFTLGSLAVAACLSVQLYFSLHRVLLLADPSESSRILDSIHLPPGKSFFFSGRFSSNRLRMDELDKLDDRDQYTSRKAAESRSAARQSRSRPPQHPINHVAVTTAPLTTIATKILNTQSGSRPDWPALCHAAGLDADSRVLVTSALSHSAGPPLVLVLARQCNVQHIAIVDPLVPNLRSTRHTLLRTYRTLLRSVDDAALIVPTSMMGLRRHDNEHEHHITWLVQYRPTHIVHLEPESVAMKYGDDDNVAQIRLDEFMSRSSQRLYSTMNSVLSLDQVLQYCHTRPGSDKMEYKKKNLTLLHVKPIWQESSNIEALQYGRLHQHIVLKHRADVAASTSSPLIRLNTLELPSLQGPMVKRALSLDDSDTAVFTEDAMVAIVQSMQRQNTGHSDTKLLKNQKIVDAHRNSTVNMTSVETEVFQQAQMAAFHLDQEQPYGSILSNPSTDTDVNLLKVAGAAYRDWLGIQTTEFPCASSCSSPTASCTSTKFDAILPASVAATTGCSYVVYIVEFDSQLSEAFQHTQPNIHDENLCRIAFVSGISPLVKRLIQTENGSIEVDLDALEQNNGKLKSNGWTLVWLPTDDDSTLTDAESTLLQMEPTRMFAKNVLKAMYTEIRAFAEPPDAALVRIMQKLDRPAQPRQRRKEYRSGLSMFRWVSTPPEQARAVALFASEPSSDFHPTNVGEYKKMADVPLPRRQLAYYHQFAHWIQNDVGWSQADRATNVYRYFPWQWVSMGVLVHDMKLEEARTLRCSWYDEYMYWGSNRGADELSLAHIIASRRLDETLGQNLADDATWIPVQSGRTRGERAKQNGAEIFLRIVQRREQN